MRWSCLRLQISTHEEITDRTHNSRQQNSTDVPASFSHARLKTGNLTRQRCNDQSSTEQSVMAKRRRWPMLHRERKGGSEVSYQAATADFQLELMNCECRTRSCPQKRNFTPGLKAITFDAGLLAAPVQVLQQLERLFVRWMAKGEGVRLTALKSRVGRSGCLVRAHTTWHTRLPFHEMSL